MHRIKITITTMRFPLLLSCLIFLTSSCSTASNNISMFTLHASCPSSGPGGCLMRSDLGYGYGWFIAQEPQGRLIYHVGHIDGFFAYNGFYPATNTDVVVLSNLETTDVLQVGRTLGGMV